MKFFEKDENWIKLLNAVTACCALFSVSWMLFDAADDRPNFPDKKDTDDCVETVLLENEGLNLKQTYHVMKDPEGKKDLALIFITKVSETPEQTCVDYQVGVGLGSTSLTRTICTPQ